MKKIFFIVAFLSGMATAYSQKHAKCDDAITIAAPSFGPISPEGWADSSLCVPGNENMYFGKTHKVAWFSFTVPNDTILTFDIVPENPTDDFDFMLFKADRSDFCQKEKQRRIKPIRTNFAKPTEYSKGKCGLSLKAQDAFVAPGFKSPYSAALKVRKGEQYYLVVDNYQGDKGGFTIKIPILVNPKPAPINNSTIDAMPVKAPHIVPLSTNNFFIHVMDSANRSIKATLILDADDQPSIKVDTNMYSMALGKYKTVKIRANAAGHMPYQSSYTSTGDTSSATFWVRLQPIKAAEKITLKDINFKGDSPEILPESEPALDYILQFMLSNPTVKIIIKGYTNDPDNTGGEKYDQMLSERRTKAVKNYLTSNGVDKDRIQCIGYGNSKLLYPHPINEDQKAANRRVEIEIQ